MQRQLVKWTAGVHSQAGELDTGRDGGHHKDTEKDRPKEKRLLAGRRCGVNLFGSCNMFSKYCVTLKRPFDKTSTPLFISMTTKHPASQEGRNSNYIPKHITEDRKRKRKRQKKGDMQRENEREQERLERELESRGDMLRGKAQRETES